MDAEGMRKSWVVIPETNEPRDALDDLFSSLVSSAPKPEKKPVPKAEPQKVKEVRAKISETYAGMWTIKGNSGEKLRYKVYVAMEDAPGLEGGKNELIFTKAAEVISKLKNFGGYNGFDALTDKAVRKALKDESYDGGWIAVPSEFYRSFGLSARETIFNGRRRPCRLVPA